MQLDDDTRLRIADGIGDHALYHTCCGTFAAVFCQSFLLLVFHTVAFFACMLVLEWFAPSSEE